MIVYHCRTCVNNGVVCQLCTWTDSSYPTMFAEKLNKEELRVAFGG
jgi:hypothetical protein